MGLSVLSAVLAGKAAGQRVAILREGREPLEWERLEGLCAGLVDDLRRLGVGPQDRVGILVPDGPDMAFCALAAMEAGICVPLNPGYPPNELAELFALTGLRFLIAQDAPAEVVMAARKIGIAVLKVRADGWSLSLDGPAAETTAEVREPKDEDTALLLLTSGSTAKPKLVPLSHRNLVAALGNLVRSLDLTSADRCLNMMPMFHVGGLVDLFLAPLSVGSSVICAPRISAETFYGVLDRDAPTWFQAVPTVLKDILTHAEAARRNLRATGLRFIRSVSSPIPSALLTAVEGAFGLPVIEIFGMTETSGLIASNPMPPGVRKQGSVGVAAGPEIGILDEAGNPAAAGKSGEVVVRGETVTAGYLNEGLKRADFFIGDWLRTGDEGYLDADGYLFITGRIKEIINRGGEKISPRQIDELVAEIDGIHEAAAYAVPHPTLGEEVAMAVVLKPGATVTREEIAAHLAPHLAAFKIPKTVTFLTALPRVPSGKLDRKAIPASVEQVRSLAQQAPFVAPQTKTQKLIARLWQKTLGVERVGIEDNFFDLGGDSLTATTFIIDLEAALGRTVPPAMLFEAPTIAGFERALATLGETVAAAEPLLPRNVYHQVRQQVAGWKGARRHSEALVVGRNTVGSKPPLFWGVTAEAEFEALAGVLDADRPLYGMRSLSLLRSKSDANTRLLGEHYAAEIAAIQPGGTIHIGGFCQGGVVAFHAAKALMRSGREISALLLQDRFIEEPFAAPVSMFWGQTTWRLNAHHAAAAEQGWNRFYSGPLAVHTLPIEHGDLYLPSQVERFAAQLDAELRRLEEGRAPDYQRRFPLAQPLPHDTYRARVSARPPLALPQSAAFDLPVTVRNEGSTTWEPTPASGIAIAGSWLNFDGHRRVDFDGYAALTAPVPPGGVFKTTLELRVPATRLPILLVIDLIEEGIGWFGERGGRPSRSVLLPLRARVPVTA